MLAHTMSNLWRTRLLRVLIAALAAAALAYISGCGGHGAAPGVEGGGKADPEGVAQAQVVAVTTRPMRETIELLGVTDPEPNSISAVSALVSARILELPLREGDSVRAGQTVAMLDPGEAPAQLAQARAQLETALNDTRQADTAIEQEKTRVASDRRQAEAALSAAKAQVSRVQSELRALQAGNRADLAQARAALETARHDRARVKAGSRPQEIAAARAAVGEADAQRQNAQAQERRAKRLFEQQVLSQKALEDAQAQARVAEAQYQAALQRERLAEEGTRKEEIAVAEARVREAEAGVEAVQTRQLSEASKQQELAAAEAQIEAAEATLARANAADRDITLRRQQRERTLAQVRQARASLQQVEARSRFLTVTAPVSGIVSRRGANQGETAQPGTVLLEIAQPGRVRFRVSAPAVRLASLRAGQPAEVRLDTADAHPLAARVAVVGTTADSSGNGSAWLALSGRGLRPGQSGKARITLRLEPAAVVVPTGALVEEEAGSAVVVVGADRIAHRRHVELGLRDGEWIQVRSGLKPGERVATVGAYEIADGMKVNATPEAGGQL